MVPYRRRSMYPRARYGGRGGRRTSFRRRQRGPMRRLPAASFAAKVRAVVKAESKFKYLKGAGQVAQGDPFFIHVSDIGQGTDASQRIGNWIQPTNLYGHITLTGNNAATQDHNGIRVLMLQWNEDDEKNQFDGTRLLQDNLTPGGPWRVTEKGVFTVLWSSYLTIVNNSDNTQFVKTLKYDIKMHKRKRVLFNANELAKFQIYFCCLTDSTSIENFPTVEAQIQLRYTDS